LVGRKLDTTSLRLDTGALAARFLEMLSDGEPFELAGRSRSMGVEAILSSNSQRLKPSCGDAMRLPTEATEAAVASQWLL
jgi:hypothetical protein